MARTRKAKTPAVHDMLIPPKRRYIARWVSPDKTDLDLLEWAHANHKHVLLEGPTATGKGLTHGTPVLLSDGSWLAVEKLAAGDLVVGKDGTPTKVEAVYHRGVQPTYEVGFSDGTSLVVDADHLWTVHQPDWNKTSQPWRTLDTETLANSDLKRGANGGNRWQIPVVQPIEYDVQPTLPIDPYVMGVLIADGSTLRDSVSFTPGDRWIADKVQNYLPDFKLTRSDAVGKATTWRITDPGRRGNRIKDVMVSLGVWGHTSPDKQIPEVYLQASLEDRTKLLHGLMDCDGWAPRQVGSEYTTSSPVLALQVLDLVRSLGGSATIRSKIPTYSHNGEQRQGKRAYAIAFRLDFNPFSLPRKSGQWAPTRGPSRHIVSIEPREPQETVCIKVSAEDGLFVTKDYIVTHNTSGVTAYCAVNDKPLVIVQCDGAATPDTLFGRWTPTPEGGARWVWGNVYLAIKHGWALLFDELNMLPPRTSASIHPLLDFRNSLVLYDHPFTHWCGPHGFLQAHQESRHKECDGFCPWDGPATIEAHEDLFVAATMNPGYAGTYDTNEALLNRFLPIAYEYDEAVEEQLIMSPTLRDIADRLRGNPSILTPVSTNRLMLFEEMVDDEDAGYLLAKETFFMHFKATERSIVANVLNDTEEADLMSDYGLTFEPDDD